MGALSVSSLIAPNGIIIKPSKGEANSGGTFFRLLSNTFTYPSALSVCRIHKKIADQYNHHHDISYLSFFEASRSMTRQKNKNYT